jgi:nicotinamide-nucleotide amidase
MDATNQLISEIAQRLKAEDLRLVTAESCTGGLVAATLTAVPGSSEWFDGGFVTYTPGAKVRMVGVRRDTLEIHGAVSEPTVREMAAGALAASDGRISVAITGVAGPDGGDVEAPVGTVWFGWGLKDPEPRCVQTSRFELEGDRESVRSKAVRIALEGVLTLLGKEP